MHGKETKAKEKKMLLLNVDREGSFAYHIINAKSHAYTQENKKLQTLIIKTTNCTSVEKKPL